MREKSFAQCPRANLSAHVREYFSDTTARAQSLVTHARLTRNSIDTYTPLTRTLTHVRLPCNPIKDYTRIYHAIPVTTTRAIPLTRRLHAQSL